jgi:hypothetical protein
MVLSEVEETITIVEINDETYEEVIRVSKYGNNIICLVFLVCISFTLSIDLNILDCKKNFRNVVCTWRRGYSGKLIFFFFYK